MCNENNKNINVDMDSSFKLNQRLSSFKSNDVCLLVDTNPRFEASSLNTRLRQYVLTGDLEVALYWS